jgi:hypothetical protein
VRARLRPARDPLRRRLRAGQDGCGPLPIRGARLPAATASSHQLGRHLADLPDVLAVKSTPGRTPAHRCRTRSSRTHVSSRVMGLFSIRATSARLWTRGSASRSSVRVGPVRPRIGLGNDRRDTATPGGPSRGHDALQLASAPWGISEAWGTDRRARESPRTIGTSETATSLPGRRGQQAWTGLDRGFSLATGRGPHVLGPSRGHARSHRSQRCRDLRPAAFQASSKCCCDCSARASSSACRRP